MSESLPAPPPPGSEGERLFEAMVRWRSLSTSGILLGFAAGFAHLVLVGTSDAEGSQIARGLALVAVVGIVLGAVGALLGYRARGRFLAWYRTNG